MKTSLLAFLLAVGTIGTVRADDFQFKVTPDTLSTWQTTGPGSVAQNKSQAVSLAPGAQLSRKSSGGIVILHEISRPSFVQDESDWPIALVGPFAAVFKQDSGKGQLVLASADGITRVIPGSYAFDAAGRSTNPIDLTLAYDSASGTIVVGVDDALQSFQIAPSLSTVEVLISAGANTGWLLDTLNVEILPEPTAATVAGPNDSLANGPSAKAKASKPTDAAKLFLASQVQKATLAASSLTPALSSGKVKPKTAAKLEIFTPPAIRAMSANLVRASIKEPQHN